MIVELGTLQIGDCFKKEGMIWMIADTDFIHQHHSVVRSGGRSMDYSFTIDVMTKSRDDFIEEHGEDAIPDKLKVAGLIDCPNCAGAGLKGVLKSTSVGDSGLRDFDTDVEPCLRCHQKGRIPIEEYVAEQRILQLKPTEPDDLPEDDGD